MPFALPALHNTQLMFRVHPCVDLHLSDDTIQLLITHRSEISAAQHTPALCEDTKLTRNRDRSAGVIAGNHDGADARMVCPGNSLLRLGSRRIDHPDDAEKNQIV